MGSAGGASGGGVTAPKPPKLTDVSCVERCAGLREAAAGGRIELSGRRLGYVEKVRFRGEDGGIAVKATKVKSRLVAITSEAIEAATGVGELRAAA